VSNAEPMAVATDAAPVAGRRRAALVSMALSALLLFLLYRTLDVGLIGDTLLGAHWGWLIVSIGLILPITLLRAIRFYAVAPGALPGVGEALRLTLAASALNVMLPSKAGDLVKSYYIAHDGGLPAGVALSVIAYERLCDLFALIGWCLLGWSLGQAEVAGAPPVFWALITGLGSVCFVLVTSERAARGLRALVDRVLPDGRLVKVRTLADGWPGLLVALRGHRRWIVSFSVLLWLAHLFQMWLFTVALRVPVPAAVFVSLVALAVMVGQRPFTVAGLGTRDVALVVLLSRYMTPESAAALGVLIATRNLLPSVFGLPLMGRYVDSAVVEARRWKQSLRQAR